MPLEPLLQYAVLLNFIKSHNNMNKIEFILSVFILVFTAIMLVNVFTTPSIVREFAITAFSIMFLLSIALVRITFREMRKGRDNIKICRHKKDV